MSTKTQVKDGPFDRLVRQRAGRMLREAEAKVEAAKAEGIAEGEAKGVAKEMARIVEAIRQAVEARGWTLDKAQQEALKQRDILALARCLGRAEDAPSLEAVLGR